MGLMVPSKRKAIQDDPSTEEDQGLLSRDREIEMRESSTTSTADKRRRRKADASGITSVSAIKDDEGLVAREISLKDVKRYFVVGLPG
jgi:hypothetical protein